MIKERGWIYFPIFVSICIGVENTHTHMPGALHIHGIHTTLNVLSVHALPELFGFNEINYIFACFFPYANVYTDSPAQENYKTIRTAP